MDVFLSNQVSRARPFGATTVSEWLRETPPDEGTVLIDLTRASFVDPVGLTVIAAIAEDAAAHEQDIEFRPPQAIGVRNYLSRMNLVPA